MNRLIAEVGFDNRKTTYHYNKLGELIEKQELSPSNPTQVLRFTEFQHDELGRQVNQRVRTSGEISQTHYQYDGLNRLTQLTDGQNTLSFSYDKVGRLTEQRQWQMNDSGFANSQVIGYRYDKNGNRLKTLLPNQSAINYHYYGSGHLSAIKYNDQLITEFSRDKLHREISRTQGSLTGQFNRDPVGRLTQQLATLESASKSAAASGEIIRRNYHYDRVGNLTESEDLRTGKTPYRYDKLGQIQLAGQELFHFDPAHNLIEKETQRIENNQLTEYQGNHYRYDEFGNLSERRLANGEIQTYRYNVKDQLIKAIIQKPNQVKEEWQYQYDVLGRRTSKVRLENGKILVDSQVEFIWDGSHLVQEIEHKTDRTFSYIYSHPNSYEPLAQLEFAKDNEKPTACYYYHNDQIGVPRELTDEEGKVCWYGSYTGWGKLKESYQANDTIHQPFRLQNQYCDQETGLHYNFFRYYEPNIGRSTQLDPIGLAGGENLYQFAPNMNVWIDPLGLARFCTRALKALPGSSDIDPNFRGGLDLGLFHEHIFYDDGTNIGYGGDGLFSEASMQGYKCSSTHYDDETMRQAVNNVKNRTKPTLEKVDNGEIVIRNNPVFGNDNYSLLMNNCQDFATEVEKEILKTKRVK
ncbi:hypothetical protein BKK49_09790 [Rodentibacter rarus]|uniref:RHS repeat-associated core domain-containing protein n=1 Tax=Rodentibacter rarus TaxID=1908260 RepID=UPI00098764DD|nr:RHS repeat-associated core domain-containing protein [Rodentibacter rarus]OOF38388.1 hypothetical protein BKK49_09790 [Rodentibacter rarus]